MKVIVRPARVVGSEQRVVLLLDETPQMMAFHRDEYVDKLMALFHWDGNASFIIDIDKLTEQDYAQLQYIVDNADIVALTENEEAITYSTTLQFFEHDTVIDDAYPPHYSMI